MGMNGHLEVWRYQLKRIEESRKKAKAEVKHMAKRKKEVSKQITNYLKKSKRRKK